MDAWIAALEKLHPHEQVADSMFHPETVELSCFVNVEQTTLPDFFNAEVERLVTDRLSDSIKTAFQ